MKNETSEHIDSHAEASISDAETKLIDWGVVTVISLENQQNPMTRVRPPVLGGFDQSHIALAGKQLGAHYFITGKVYTADERVGDKRRVQYFFFMQVIEVQTARSCWQNKTNVTKASFAEHSRSRALSGGLAWRSCGWCASGCRSRR